jgi:hypothetical protein
MVGLGGRMGKAGVGGETHTRGRQARILFFSSPHNISSKQNSVFQDNGTDYVQMPGMPLIASDYTTPPKQVR